MDDPKLDHLKQLLEQFLEADMDITAPALVVASDQFKHPSDITRPKLRGPLFHDYRQRQINLRELARKTDKNSKGKLIARLAGAETRVSIAEQNSELLAAAVRGLIRSVGNAQGLKGWQAMFADYVTFRDKLLAIGAIPAADVKPFKPRPEAEP